MVKYIVYIYIFELSYSKISKSCLCYAIVLTLDIADDVAYLVFSQTIL